MAASFFFYDLETSGINPRSARVMQFAGQRTDMNLNPVGEPVNIFIKLTPDNLPEPEAVLLTGITPQQTIAEGVTEAEFLKIFYQEVVKPDTIFLGFNSVRFDDEFMRFLHYRNFYDAYEWQWKDGCSRWDILDLVRMTRALRPDGIEWPFSSDGKPSNKLELLTAVNKISHDGAHDALSDVNATISVAKLIKSKQPELFDYLLPMRSKREVAKLVEKNEPFIYTSSHFPSKYLHTTAVTLLAPHPGQDSALVYDLRYDPLPFLKMDLDDIVESWKYSKDPDAIQLPVKTLKYNRVPAIAPMGVIKDENVQARIDINLETITSNLKKLRDNQEEFAAKVIEAVEVLDDIQDKKQVTLIDDVSNVDERLYEGFVSKSDASLMYSLRTQEPDKLNDLAQNLHDKRLKALLPLYKARNYPKSLSNEERIAWEEFCLKKLTGGGKSSMMAKYFSKLHELAAGKVNKKQQYLLEELMLYGQSIVPSDESDNEAH